MTLACIREDELFHLMRRYKTLNDPQERAVRNFLRYTFVTRRDNVIYMISEGQTQRSVALLFAFSFVPSIRASFLLDLNAFWKN